jgi:hypothetical protein
MDAHKENQRAAIMTLFQKVGGWQKYQVKEIKAVLGDERVAVNTAHPEILVVLGKIEKRVIANITNETKFTSHPIIGYDNPRLHHWKPF